MKENASRTSPGEQGPNLSIRAGQGASFFWAAQCPFNSLPVGSGLRFRRKRLQLVLRHAACVLSWARYSRCRALPFKVPLEERGMLRLALVFLLIALLAGALGFP